VPCNLNETVVLTEIIEIGNYLLCNLHLHLLVINCDGLGVEDAFCATGKVLTVSFHKHSPGFFPGMSTAVISNYSCHISLINLSSNISLIICFN